MLLPYQVEIDHDVQASDALHVLARGLGMSAAVSRFLAAKCRPNRLIVVLNVPRSVAVDALWPAAAMAARAAKVDDASIFLPRFINADYSTRERADVYKIGGVIMVSSAVLVNDLLLRNLPVAKVDGIVVFAAEKVTNNSNSHFALTLFRLQNRTAFIKAFSENPVALAAGFHNAEKVMRTLFVSRLNIWPRYHQSVKASLSRRTPDVVDLSVPLSPSQAALLSALRDVVARVLHDLRQSSHSLDLTDVFCAQQLGATGPPKLAPNFDDVVRRQLIENPKRRVVSGNDKVRSLVSDLTTLRGLISDAIDLNSILFYQHVMTLRHTQTRASYWLMRREAQHALGIARGRVFRKQQAISDYRAKHISNKRRRTSVGSAPCESERIHTVPVLDPCTKWSTLQSVLEEIQSDVKEIGPGKDVGRVLLVVREKRLVDELRHVLAHGPRHYMEGLMQSVLPSVAKSFGENCCDERRGSETTTAILANQRAAAAVPSLDDDTVDGKSRLTGPTNTGTMSWKGKASAHGKHEYLQDAWRLGTRRNQASTAARIESGQCSEPRCGDVTRDDSSAWPWPIRLPTRVPEGELLAGIREYFGVESAGNPARAVEVLLWCLDWVDAQGRGARLLAEYRPAFVVMYNADACFLRQLEVFRSETPGHALRVYILTYEDAVEEDRYLDAINRERKAFRTLIRERATMVVHEDQEGRKRGVQAQDDPICTTLSAVGRGLDDVKDSRVAPTASGQVPSPVVVVDTRELRSALPMMLFKARVDIKPVTLEVGDFVLSKTIAVERKSVPDLYGSFNSGRLFKQASALCRHYHHPCLLIELEAPAKLSLAATSGGVASEIAPNSIISKIVLLVHQFPSLRLLWARGPQDAADLFLTLKSTREEPNVEAAGRCGVDSEGGEGSDFNSAPAALLRSLPGIDGHNITAVMRKVRNVSDLLRMSRKEMSDVLGSSLKGQQLYEFANEKPSEAFAAL